MSKPSSKCPKDHTPNEITKKALENLKVRKCLQKADTVEELFEKLKSIEHYEK